jgi:hypothetical protein
MTTATSGAPSRRRRRGGVILLVVILVLAVLVVVADFAARAYGEGRIRTEIAGALDIPDDDAIDVDIRGFSALLQAAAGRLEQVDIGLDQVSFGELSGSSDITLRGVPIDRSGTTDAIDIAVQMPPDQIESLVARLSDREVDSIEMAGDQVEITAPVTVLGLSLPVTVSLDASAESGDLALTPVSVEASGQTLSVEQVEERFGGAIASALETQTVCVAEYIPSILTLEDAAVDDGMLSLRFHGEDAPLSRAAFEQTGTCD